MSDEVLNGAAEAATEGTTAPVVETPAPEAPATQAVNLDDELSQIYKRSNPDRDPAGRFASDKPADEAVQDLEGKPATETPEPAIAPAIAAPHSMPSALKDEWAKVPPAAQDWIAKREAEAHRSITHLGEQVKAYEPIARLAESYRDAFQNERRNVPFEAGLQQLLEAQRQLDRDPVNSIAHIAKHYGVDLSVFANQNGEQSGQSPETAALAAQLRTLSERNAQLERLVMSREQREQQAQHETTLSAVDEFLREKGYQNENDLEPDLFAEFMDQLNVVRSRNPGMSHKEVLQKAYDKAVWAEPKIRERTQLKLREAEKAKETAEAVKKAAEAKRAGQINVRSTPGAARPVRDLDAELSAIYRARSA